MSQSFCPYCMNPIEPGQSCRVCGLTEGSYTPAPHHLPPGTVLKERYLIGRALGEGGFGITYIGCDLQLEVKVAVKEYFPVNRVSRMSENSLSVSCYAGAAGEGYRKDLDRFLQEARTMAKLSKQPTIVSVHDFFEGNGTAYIVMEYIDGTTFRDLVKQRGGKIPAWELLHLIEPLFFALQTVHDAGLIHRDLSPENLMLEDGAVRLLDFGCAREVGGDKTLTVSLKHSYAPVEQYQGKGQGPWTDVYALAATIYYCLTGIKPPQAMDRLVEDELILPRKMGVELTEKQEKALLRAMNVRPRHRYQSMTEFHAALYEGIETMPKSPVLMTIGGAAAEIPASETLQDGFSGKQKGAVLFDADVENREDTAQEKPAESGGAASDGGHTAEGGTASDGGHTTEGGTASDGGHTTEGGAASDGGHTTEGGAGDADDESSGSAAKEEKSSESGLIAWIKGHRILAAILLAVILVILILAIVLAVRSRGSGTSLSEDTSADTAAAESKTGENGTEDTASYELIGATAYVLDGTEEALRTALEDDAAESVLVSDKDIDLTDGILYINKPLTLEANVWTADSVIVGESGELIIDCAQSGAEGLTMKGLLSTRDGGTITVKTGSEISSDGSGYILYLESWDDLAIEDGASMDLLERTDDDGEIYHETGVNYSDAFAIDEDALFADAYEADSETALRAAMYDDSVSAVTVTADITLTEEFIQIKPVRIAEGVTVTALQDEQAVSEDGETIISLEEASEDTESVYAVWNISGSVLINHGTLRGYLNTSDPDDTAFSGDEPYLINDGTLTIAMDTCRDGTLVNLEDGTFTWMYDSAGCYVVNLGTFLCSSTVSGAATVCVLDPGFAFFNSGTLQIETTQWQPDEGSAEFNILDGVLCNLSGGSIQIGENGQLNASGDITNYGSIVLTDSSACFLNHRYLALAAGSTLNVRTGQFDNNGIIQSAADASYVSNDGATGHWINVLRYDVGWAEDVTEVTNAQELEEALADESVSVIWWYEEITWEGDLDVSGKALLGTGLLTITGGDLILSGSDTSAELDGVNLSSGGILLSDDATMLLHEYDGGAAEVGTLEVTGGALLMTTGGTYLADTKIVIEGEGSKVLSVGNGVMLQNCEVQVGDGGVLGGVTSVPEDDTSTVTISSGGILSFELGGASIACTIVNEGTIEMYRDVTIASGGSLTSYGDLEVGSACELTVQGTLDNQGSITVEGQITAEDGGTVNGYEDETNDDG